MSELDVKLKSLAERTASLAPPAGASERLHAALKAEAEAPTRGPDLASGGGGSRRWLAILLVLAVIAAGGAVVVLLIAGA